MEIAALTDWLVVCITIGRKEIGRKKCKAERARGPGTESWERNRQRGLGKVTAAWGNHCFIFCASNGLAGRRDQLEFVQKRQKRETAAAAGFEK